MNPPAPDTLVLVGKVTRTHGLVGEVKVFPITDDPYRLLDLNRVFVGTTPHQVTPFDVERARIQEVKRGLQVILKLSRLNSLEEAMLVHKQFVYVAEDDLPLADDEFFLHDLIGLPVETDIGEQIGTIKDVMQLPAHEVFVVARPNEADAMVPAVPAFVVEADPRAGRVVIRPIEGLLD